MPARPQSPSGSQQHGHISSSSTTSLVSNSTSSTRTVWDVIYGDPQGQAHTTIIDGVTPTITVTGASTYVTHITTTSTAATLITKATSTLTDGSGTETGRSTITNYITTSYPVVVLAYSAAGNRTIPSSSTSRNSTVSSPTKSSTSPTSSHSPKSSDAGAIAGAAVGCFIGGALIAGLLVWLFMSSRRKKQRHTGAFADRRNGTGFSHGEKAQPTAPLLGGAAAAAAGWEQHLPQSESDGTIRRDVKGLFDQIELHVENFYRDASVPITPEVQSRWMEVDSNHLPDSVVGLLPQTRSPTLLIKHCLAQLIVSHITAEGDTSDSFLPIDFIALPGALGTSRSNTNKPAFDQAFSRWRLLSAYLRPRAQDDRTYLAKRDANITAIADTFCAAWTPWATGETSVDARRQHLINIMKSAADTGILIFSQPSGFVYRWNVPRDKERKGQVQVVVSPGFVKVTDEHAKELLGGKGQELVAPVVGTL